MQTEVHMRKPEDAICLHIYIYLASSQEIQKCISRYLQYE